MQSWLLAASLCLHDGPFHRQEQQRANIHGRSSAGLVQECMASVLRNDLDGIVKIVVSVVALLNTIVEDMDCFGLPQAAEYGKDQKWVKEEAG